LAHVGRPTSRPVRLGGGKRHRSSHDKPRLTGPAWRETRTDIAPSAGPVDRLQLGRELWTPSQAPPGPALRVPPHVPTDRRYGPSACRSIGETSPRSCLSSCHGIPWHLDR
jgi:hypothetical protein